MRIKNVKPGSIIKLRSRHIDKDQYSDTKWIVDKVYRNHVLAHSVKIPEIRRSFCYGDLVIMGLEGSGIEAFNQ